MMTIKLYTLFIFLCFGLSTSYSQKPASYEKLIKLTSNRECESAISYFQNNKDYFNALNTAKKLQSFLAISSSCKKDRDLKTLSLAYLDSIIQHPQALKYPQIVRKAFNQKSNFFIFDKDKSLANLLEQQTFEETVGDKNALAVCYAHIGGTYYLEEQNELAFQYFKKALNTTQNTNDSIIAYVGLANTSPTQPLLADSLFQIAVKACDHLSDSIRYASTLKSYGRFLSTQGKHNKAIDNLIKSASLFPNTKRMNLSRVYTYSEISDLFLEIGDHERALKYILKSIKICEENNYRARNGIIAMTYGKVLRALGKWEMAKEEFEKALVTFEKKKRLNSQIGTIGFLGLLAIDENDLELANFYYQKGIKIYDQLKGENNKNIFLRFSGRRFKLLEQYEASEQAFKALQKLGRQRGRAEMEIRALTELSKLKQETGDFESSLVYYKSYKFLEDSIYRAYQRQLIFDIESKYNRAEQDKAIALLDAENIRTQSTLSKQNSIIFIGGIALLLISILSFFLFNLYQKVAEQKKQIGKALLEKDTLLREIHHRVKNNLQLVSSLLSLQSRHVEDENALEVLNSGKSRIRSMALIHQDLYNRENLTGVSVREYLEKLCKELNSTYQVDPEKVSLHVEIEDLALDVDTLVPLGLIINELLTNALKYAFPENRGGKIIVRLFELNNQLRLEIEDNGIGMDISNKSESSFGYKLVNTLLNQLKGNLQQKSDNGTQIFLTFDHYKIAA